MGLVLGIAALVAGCDGTSSPSVEREWQASLMGEAGWEHVTGAAVVQTLPGTGFTAVVELTGDEPGEVRPWHVHFNTCAEGGGIVGTDAEYPRLTIGAEGTATSAVTLPLPLQVGADYHVNVHRADDDLGTLIACGDLELVN